MFIKNRPIKKRNFTADQSVIKYLTRICNFSYFFVRILTKFLRKVSDIFVIKAIYFDGKYHYIWKYVVLLCIFDVKKSNENIKLKIHKIANT